VGEFFQSLVRYPFLQQALLGGLLASIASGVVGSFVVTRRISYLAGGIAHAVLGGLGFARYAQVVWGWEAFTPLLGATFAALLSAALLGWVSLRMKEREDTAISALWAIGMAIGLLFIAKTPGYREDLMRYLMGDILFISRQDLMLIGVLDALVLAAGIGFYNQLLALCFDEEFARLRGLNTGRWYLFLLVLTALTVVTLLMVVGIVLVIALLTLPAAIGARLSGRLDRIMLISTLLSAATVTLGIALSYGPKLPPGPTIIVLAGGLYLAVLVVPSLFATRRR